MIGLGKRVRHLDFWGIRHSKIWGLGFCSLAVPCFARFGSEFGRLFRRH